MPIARSFFSTANAPPHQVAVAHILVVDDSRLQRRILSASLKRWGFKVTEASSGEEALGCITEDRPDLVLSDWMMPGMSGVELCKRLRAIEDAPYCYFILLTSNSEKDAVAHGLENGADDFLSKPVDSNELRARITAGGRLLDMQREMALANEALSETLGELRRLHDHIDKDLQEAKKLQQSLLRERYRRLDAGVLSLMLRSSGHVGGDLVGFFDAGNDHLGLYALDVSGHGISSALMTARLAGYLSSAAPEQNVALRKNPDGQYAPRPPAEVVSELNNLVLDEMETEHYFTLLLGFVELSSGRMQMCQAGHPHPAVQRQNGTVEHHGEGGFPVGLLSDAQFEPFELSLDPGDRILILSDGVTECPGPNGEMLAEEGLSELMHTLRSTQGPPFLEAMMWYLEEFNGSGDFTDDISAILFEYQPRDSAT